MRASDSFVAQATLERMAVLSDTLGRQPGTLAPSIACHLEL
jgi:hypothetical protein